MKHHSIPIVQISFDSEWSDVIPFRLFRQHYFIITGQISFHLTIQTSSFHSNWSNLFHSNYLRY